MKVVVLVLSTFLFVQSAHALKVTLAAELVKYVSRFEAVGKDLVAMNSVNPAHPVGVESIEVTKANQSYDSDGGDDLCWIEYKVQFKNFSDDTVAVIGKSGLKVYRDVISGNCKGLK